MIDVAQADNQLDALMYRFKGGWLPEKDYQTVQASRQTGNPAATFQRLCAGLNQPGVVITWSRYKQVAALGQALMLPTTLWSSVRYYLPESA